ncbi:MAG: hypothetical protein HC927_00695 [Deltaproteobacteria bacterium]|nr:hypothetical protein [Deltaproteobacteria bacterium]
MLTRYQTFTILLVSLGLSSCCLKRVTFVVDDARTMVPVKMQLNNEADRTITTCPWAKVAADPDGDDDSCQADATPLPAGKSRIVGVAWLVCREIEGQEYPTLYLEGAHGDFVRQPPGSLTAASVEVATLGEGDVVCYDQANVNGDRLPQWFDAKCRLQQGARASSLELELELTVKSGCTDRCCTTLSVAGGS